MKVTDIKPNPNNPRIIKDDKFKKLVKSIQDFPQMLELRPMIVDNDNVLLGGNMRLKAIQELGMEDIPDTWVKKASELTEEQKKEFIIKDNVGFGEWDWDMLANEWEVEQLNDWGLDLPDFEVEPEAKEDDYEIPDTIETDIVLGDLFEIGEHRLLCGDSTDSDSWQKLMGEHKIDLVVTDPPYNVDYVGKTKEKLKISNDKMSQDSFYQFLYDFYNSISLFTKLGGCYYIFHADSEGHNFRKAFLDTAHHLSQCLVWVKNSIVMGRNDYHWQHEPILYGWKEGGKHSWYSDRTQKTVLNFDRPQRNTEHPTMKPIELLSYLITNSSKQDDLIGDGFLGSGSTMVASHQLKRKCYGMELDPKYCQVIIDRMLKLDENLVVKRNGEVWQTMKI